MKMTELIQGGLSREVHSRVGRSRFAEAAGKEPSLSSFESPEEALGVLADRTTVSYVEKEAVTQALLRMQQLEPNSFWSSMLTLAYFPMLMRLRHRIFGNAYTPDELDQLVLHSFLEEAVSLDPAKGRTALRLRQGTARRVFRTLRRRQGELARFIRSELEEGLIDEERMLELTPRETPSSSKPDPEDQRAQRELLELPAVKNAFRGREDQLHLVEVTLIDGESLPSYVERSCSDQPPTDRARTYQRLKRRHSRAITRLRKALADFREASREGVFDDCSCS